MSECENWQLYREEINRKLASGTSFVPFLGMFLTQVRICIMMSHDV